MPTYQACVTMPACTCVRPIRLCLPTPISSTLSHPDTWPPQPPPHPTCAPPAPRPPLNCRPARRSLTPTPTPPAPDPCLQVHAELCRARDPDQLCALPAAGLQDQQQLWPLRRGPQDLGWHSQQVPRHRQPGARGEGGRAERLGGAGRGRARLVGCCCTACMRPGGEGARSLPRSACLNGRVHPGKCCTLQSGLRVWMCVCGGA